MSERKMTVLTWTLIVLTVAFIVYLASSERAHAHAAAHPSSDEPTDPGPNIQVYKDPGSLFFGTFSDARREWNAATPSSGPKFRMVDDPARAELYVLGNSYGCMGDANGYLGYVNRFDRAADILWVDTGCATENLRALMLHELGHALAQEHHDCEDHSSVMSHCAYYVPISHLTLHDKVSVNGAYGY